MDDLYKLLNEVSIDEIELEEVKVTQAEKERIKKNLKLNILSCEHDSEKYTRKSKFINKKMIISLASCLAIIVTIGLFNSNKTIVQESSDNSYTIMVNLNGSNYYFSNYIEENENILGNYLGTINKKVEVDISPKAGESNYFDSGTNIYKEKDGDGIIAIDKDGQYILLQRHEMKGDYQ
ncbi:MAG: hypothetical protein ACRDD7_04100 [Peptostreptococcaceae bacterium]